ncbi:MAG: hypothetical protein HKL99_14115 [Burkholderiales bacterium]|nr:hypothetical protein [Burkholderiales bacterium]
MPIELATTASHLAQLRALASLCQSPANDPIGADHARSAAKTIANTLNALGAGADREYALDLTRQMAVAQPAIDDAIMGEAPDLWLELEPKAAECPYPAYYDPGYYDAEDFPAHTM